MRMENVPEMRPGSINNFQGKASKAEKTAPAIPQSVKIDAEDLNLLRKDPLQFLGRSLVNYKKSDSTPVNLKSINDGTAKNIAKDMVYFVGNYNKVEKSNKISDLYYEKTGDIKNSLIAGDMYLKEFDSK